MNIALRYQLAGFICAFGLLASSCDKLGMKSSPTSASPGPSGPAAEETRQRALEEVLAEMMRVVLRREPKDSVEFTSWLEALYQGASTEGIYRGFTHSSDFRKIEAEGPAAKPECVNRFVREMKRLQGAMQSPTVFKDKDAEILSEVVNPEEAPEAKHGMLPALKFGAAAKTEVKPAAPVATGPVDLAKLFAKAKFYTLKRVLGDEALKLLQEKSAQGARAEWYGAWAADLGGLGVDFGIPLRNQTDKEFHQKWALASEENRLTWEVLNRLHRVMNGCL